MDGGWVGFYTCDRLDWNFLDPTRKVGLKKPSNPTNPYTHYSNFFKKNLRVFGVYYYTKVFEMPYDRVSKRKKKKKYHMLASLDVFQFSFKS